MTFQIIGARVRRAWPKIYRPITKLVSTCLNWRSVRSVGELQILTRASYAALVVVPILAGMWPTVRVVVNRHNEVIAAATDRLEKATQDYSEQAQRLLSEIDPRLRFLPDPQGEASRIRSGIAASKAKLDGITQSVTQELVDLRRFSAFSPTLPGIWAHAFFAALAIIIAHTIYQLSASPIIRNDTLDSYVGRIRDDFVKTPTDEAIRLADDKIFRMRQAHFPNELSRIHKEHRETASVILDAYEVWVKHEESPEKPDTIAFDAAFRSARTHLINVGDFLARTVIKELELEYSTVQFRSFVKELRNDPFYFDRGREQEYNVEKISRSARMEYLEAARLKPFLALISSLIYGIGIALLFYILYRQSISVAQVAGWLS